MIFKILIFKVLIGLSVAPPTDPGQSEEDCPPDCDSPIYCYGELLQAVQLAEIHEHPKYFVDKKLINSPQHILDEFQKLKVAGKLDPDSLKVFVDEHFAVDNPIPCELQDIDLQPKLLGRIKDPVYQKFVEDLQKIWSELAVRVDERAKEQPELHSFVYLPKCYIKAGGFFTSQFLWDSYWILKGLTVTGMVNTAKDMLINFFYLIEKFGFVLNASRIYYSRRSQPPFLTAMVKHYLDANPQDEEFLKSNLHLLDIEFHWWMTNRSVKFTKDGKEYTMYQYHQKACLPRPEGYVKDYKKAQEFNSKPEMDYFYTQTHSVAESGLDFSTRQRRPDFYEPGYGTRKNLDITSLVPVELNCLLAMNANLLSKWFKKVGNIRKANYYDEISKNLIQWIEEVFRDDNLGAWFDWDIKTNKHRTNFYPTNLVALYAQCYDVTKNEEIGAGAVEYLKKAHIIHGDGQPKFYGVPTSMILSPEQWDYGNSWAPMNSFVIEGLYKTGQKDAMEVAFNLAKIWVKTNYLGFKSTKHMFEKYDVILPGETGGGGTYKPQVGFGWTNGFLLVLFDLFGSQLKHTDYNGFSPDDTGVNKNAGVEQ